MIVWRSFETVGKDQTHFCHIWPIKSGIRYNTQPMTERAYDRDTKSVCLVHRGEWSAQRRLGEPIVQKLANARRKQ